MGMFPAHTFSLQHPSELGPSTGTNVYATFAVFFRYFFAFSLFSVPLSGNLNLKPLYVDGSLEIFGIVVIILTQRIKLKFLFILHGKKKEKI